MMDTILQLVGWYCVLSVCLGWYIAISIRYDRWRHDTGRDVTFSPNKDKLGYLMAAIIGCPFINLLAVALVLWGHRFKGRQW